MAVVNLPTASEVLQVRKEQALHAMYASVSRMNRAYAEGIPLEVDIERDHQRWLRGTFEAAS